MKGRMKDLPLLLCEKLILSRDADREISISWNTFGANEVFR